MGLNEAAGYGGVALAAAASGWLAAEFVARDVLVIGGFAVASWSLWRSASSSFGTPGHTSPSSRPATIPAPTAALHACAMPFSTTSFRNPGLRACSQAGLVNNLNDALAWGLVPLFLAADGASPGQIGLVAGIYPAVWGLGQIWTGHWSDSVGRKPLIVAGMLLQAGALALLSASGGRDRRGGSCRDRARRRHRARLSDPDRGDLGRRHPGRSSATVGVYRFWRDMGYVVGGLSVGLLADAIDPAATIAVVAGLTAFSGLWVAVDLPRGRTSAGESAAVRAGMITGA